MPNRKTELYRALKAQGWTPDKGFAYYKMEDLERISMGYPSESVQEPELPELLLPDEDRRPPEPPAGPAEQHYSAQADPEELPNQRINTKDEDAVIRVDDQGRQWLQEEVRKPAYPKPRGRRVLTYLETGVKTETVQNGEYVETFEVAGDRATRPSEVKITLPSYQVGIYKDPRFPFKVHCYNGQEGFDLHDVNDFYGGSELVPYGVKRIYIENDLCYDIRSVIQAINNEYRQIQLTGKAYQ